MDESLAKTQSSSLPSIGALFSQSWQTFTQSMLSLFILNILGIVIYIGLAVVAFLFFILSGAGSFLLKNGLQGIATTLPSISGSTIAILVVIAVIFGLISLIVGSILQIASILLVDSQGKTSMGSAFKKSLSLIVPLSLVSILTFILTLGGLFVFILPAILFSFLLIFVQFEVILNNQRWLEALRRSVLLVSRHFGGILIRLILLILIYLAYAIVTNLIGKIGSEIQVLVGIISFLINLLLGWFAIAYQITLYKQARNGLEQEKGKGILWIWIVAILGWLIAVGIFFAVWKAISSGILNNLSPKTSSTQALNSQNSTMTAIDLVKDANSKAQEVINIQNNSNATYAERSKVTSLISSALSEYKQATEKDPSNTDAWSSLGIINKLLGDTVSKSQNPDQSLIYTFYNESAMAYYKLGQLYLEKGSKDIAKESLQKALEIVPVNNLTLKNTIQQALKSI